MIGQVSDISYRTSNQKISIWYTALLSAAVLWAIFNCAYVYLVLAGGRTYRIESSVLFFVALLIPTALARAAVARNLELPRRWLWAIAVGAAAMWLAIMAPLVTYPFLSDDYVFFGRYQSWSDLFSSQIFFRPLFSGVFWFCARIGDGSTIPFHIVGFILHGGCAALVGLLARRILRSATAGFVSFTLFLVNPLQLEATLWVSGLQELLCAFLVLSAALVYSRGLEPTLRTALAATPFIIFALLSKETAVGYLLFLPVLDLALGRIKRGSEVWRNYLLFAGIAIAYLIVRSRFTVADAGFLAEPSRYFFKQLVTLPYKFFAQPWNAEAVRTPLVVSFALCAAVLMLLYASGVANRLSRVSLAGSLIVISFTLPVYTYFFVAPDLAGSRYLYLPCVGWVLLLADVLTSTLRRSAVLVVPVVLIAFASLVVLRLNLRPWMTASDAIAVMERAIERNLSPLDALNAWEAQRSIRLTRRGNVPIEYQGVYILLNGHEEFVRFASARVAAR